MTGQSPLSKLTSDQGVDAGRLALGTAQFGLSYGISNRRGRVDRKQACAIVAEALEKGVRTIDTAEAYGRAERTIACALASSQFDTELVTKFPGGVTGRSLPKHLAGSLARLRARRLDGYLAHDPASLLDPGVVEALREARDNGLILAFGASVYYPREVEACLERDIDLGIVQLPYSMVDQRFRALLPELQKRKIRVHARSAFLQGLLLMSPEEVPAALAGMRGSIGALGAEAARLGISLQALLLAACLCQPGVERVVVGVTTVEELLMNISSLKAAAACPTEQAQTAAFVVSDEELILPTHWPKDVSHAL